MTRPPTSQAERNALDLLDEAELLAILTRLVAIPSLGEASSSHEAGERESEAQRLMDSELTKAGLETDLWEIDLHRLGRHPAYSAEIERTQALGLVGTRPGRGGGPTLILNGHVDVVPAGDLSAWPHPPFEARCRDGWISGRGVLDMKGGLACAVAALAAIGKADIELAGSVHLQSVVGEEDGGLGTLATCLRGYRGDGAIIMEPTAATVVSAQAGCANFELEVPGLSAHGCHRDEGVSAIEKFAVVHQNLLELERRYNRAHSHPLFAHLPKPYPLSVGTLSAGDWPSSVPDKLVARGRFGVALEHTLDEARTLFENALDAVNRNDPWLREHNATVSWWGGQFEPAETRVDEPLVQTLVAAAHDEWGRSPAIVGVPYGSDMRLLVHEGSTPTVLFGPGDVRLAHAPQERVAVRELVAVARTLVRTIIRFCGLA